MEGANEAARRAVSAILDRSDSGERRCTIWPLKEPAVCDRAKQLDERLLAARAAGSHAFDRLPGPGLTLETLSGEFGRLLDGRPATIGTRAATA